MATAALLSGQYDDGLTTKYEVLPDATPTHIQHSGGIGRTAVQFLAGQAIIGQSVKSVWLRFRKYGLPTGPITVYIRKGSDDTVAATIGTFDIQHFPQNTETELTIRNRFNNTYNMVANDSVSVEFPSNATNGFEITTHSTAGNPTNTTSRSHNGTAWSATTDPLCITIKS